MRYLGIDYGTRRVGVAVSDERGVIAFPKEVITNNGGLIPTLKDICDEYDVACVVMGESRDVSGEPNPVMRHAQECADTIRTQLAIPIEWEREDFTSVKAREIQGKVYNSDASAAALILQSYLDRVNDNL